MAGANAVKGYKKNMAVSLFCHQLCSSADKRAINTSSFIFLEVPSIITERREQQHGTNKRDKLSRQLKLEIVVGEREKKENQSVTRWNEKEEFDFCGER